MPVVELSISGNDKQETRSGYNKIKIIRANETKSGITFTNNGDGSFTLNGTNNATGAIYFNLNLDSNNAEYFTLTKNKKYYMYLKGLKTGTSLMARSRNNQNFSLILSNGISKITEWTKETATDGITYIEVLPGTTFNNETFYPMIAESDIELEYEAYGAMPSPEFPSEIECVGDNVNMLNIADIEETESSGVKYSVKNGILKLDGTATSGMQINLESNITIKKGTYTHSCNYIQKGLYISFDNLHANMLNVDSSQKTFVLTEDTIYTRYFLWIDKGTVLNDVEIKLKLEKGKESTSWSSYGMGSVNVEIENRNVFSFEKAEKLSTYAMPSYKVIDNNIIELYNSNDWAYIQYKYTLKKNTQYTISFDLEFEGAENVTQWWITITDSQGNIITDYVSLVNNKYIKTFITREEKFVKIKFFASTVINPTLTIIKNIQIEEGNTATEFVSHFEQTKTVDIQQPMLFGDYFVKEKDGWKEVHLKDKEIFDGTEEGWNTSATDTSGINRFSNSLLSTAIKKVSNSNEIADLKSDKFIAVSANQTYSKIEGISINASGTIYIFYNACSSMDKIEFINWLSANPFYIWYNLATPLKLVCTETQNKQLDDLLNTSTYKNVTHIYSTDKVSPIIKIVYKKDLDTILNNQKNEYDTRLSNIEKLLTTTTTSALLLDNLQSDLEKEVL